MHDLKSAKIFFFLAVLLFVAKPFLGFTAFSSPTHPTAESIFVKSFTKRKIEHSENSNFNIIAIQKKLAEPVKHFLLSFSFLLTLIFPVVFGMKINITNRFLRNLQLSSLQREHTYLLNAKLII